MRPQLIYQCSLCHRIAFKDPLDLFPSENCTHNFASNYLRLDPYGSKSLNPRFKEQLG